MIIYLEEATLQMRILVTDCPSGMHADTSTGMHRCGIVDYMNALFPCSSTKTKMKDTLMA